MQSRGRSTTPLVFAAVGMLAIASCEQTKSPPPPTARPVVSENEVVLPPGVAGGHSRQVVVVESIVTAVDTAARKVTLRGADGRQFTFNVVPEIKDLSLLKPGDKVTATFERRASVEVRRDEAPPSDSFETEYGYSQAGQMPGRLYAEESKKVAKVLAIDHFARRADLQFADDIVRGIPLRPDVDLKKYKVGDSVIIQVTNALTVLSRKP